MRRSRQANDNLIALSSKENSIQLYDISQHESNDLNEILDNTSNPDQRTENQEIPGGKN